MVRHSKLLKAKRSKPKAKVFKGQRAEIKAETNPLYICYAWKHVLRCVLTASSQDNGYYVETLFIS